MGGAKRQMEDDEARRAVAIRIALECGTLSQCEDHGDIFEGTGDVEEAIEAGIEQLAVTNLDLIFESVEQMKEVMEAVVRDNAADECPSCARRDAE